MSAEGVYVYGLVRAAEGRELGSIGVDLGGVPAPVRPLATGAVAALVSACPTRRPPAPLSRNVAAHSRVIQEALRTSTVVPLAFGHVARHEREVARRLQQQGAAILAEIERLEGKVEVGLRVRWDVGNIFQYMVDRDDTLSALRDRLYGRAQPPTAAEKLELGRLFEERLKWERLTATEHLLDALAWDAVEIDIGTAHGEKTVADLSFLVLRETAPAFKEKMVALAESWPTEIVFQPSGPWAPYHFVHLQLDGGDAEDGGLPCAS